jgi:hypothetical protein
LSTSSTLTPANLDARIIIPALGLPPEQHAFSIAFAVVPIAAASFGPPPTRVRMNRSAAFAAAVS